MSLIDSQTILLAGHRGLGCTDHDFYQDVRDIPNLPVENTVGSIDAAFDANAAYVEIDVVETKDKHLIVLHNVVGKDHFFGVNIPPDLLNTMTLADIRQYKTGRNGMGEVALFADVLDVVSQKAPGTAPWKINVELKHLAGSNQAYADDGFFDNVAHVVHASSLRESDILFSSFGFINIQNMSHRLPNAHYGQLCREYKDGDDVEPVEGGIYTDYRNDPRYCYRPFNLKTIETVQADWTAHAHPDARLGYFNPEIMTIHPSLITAIAKRDMGLNAWSLFETTPDRARLDMYARVAAECTRQNVPLTIITDYLPEMKTVFPQP